MNDDDIKNPFSDPEFRDMLLKKEGIKDNTGFDILIPEDVTPENEMKGIISNAPTIPGSKGIKRVIHDASSLAKQEKEERSQQMSLALNNLFSQFNEKYGLEVNVCFDDISKSIVALADPKSRRELELYVSNTFEGFKSLIYIKLMSSMSIVIDHMLDPSRLMSGDFSSADYFLIVEKLMSYIETLERLKSSIVIQGASVELDRLGSEDTGGADNMSHEAKEFLKMMKKSKGIE
jgi:hypothetical protein